MRDLLKVVEAIKSASDILSVRGRADLLALAYLGGYIAPEHEYVSLDPSGSYDGLIPRDEFEALMRGASDLGLFGERAPVPVTGNVRLRSVFGESYALGSMSYGREEVVFDVPQDIDVRSVFVGYVSHVGSDNVEIRSRDQRVIVRYVGVKALTGVVVGREVTQGERFGKTSAYALGVTLIIDGIPRNLLQVYSETESRKWFEAWEGRNPDGRSKLRFEDPIVDTFWHVRANELNKNNASSYLNPYEFTYLYGKTRDELTFGDDGKPIVPEPPENP
jgi:hypothetical protein